MSTVSTYFFAFNEPRFVNKLTSDEIHSQITKYKFAKPWEKIPSLFEVLYNEDFVKIFMDVENYHDETFDTLDRLIESFRDYFNAKTTMELGKYVLTENKHSRHPGRSFHVIFPEYKLKLYNLRRLVVGFIEQHKEFADIVDRCVYSNNRLFRLPLQHGIAGNGKDEIHYCDIRARKPEVWEQWEKAYGNENYHDFIHRPGITVDHIYERYIIKETSDCVEITTGFTCSKEFVGGFSGGRTRCNNLPVVKELCGVLSTAIASTVDVIKSQTFETPKIQNTDSAIKVALLSLEYSGETYHERIRDLLNRLNEYYSKNNTYNNFEDNGRVLTSEEVLTLVKIVFDIKNI